MFAYLLRRRLIVPIAPALGGATGLILALFIALMPGTMLDALVAATGIPSILAAAAPPLGGTARAVLVLFGGGGAAVLVGLGGFFLFGTRALAIRPPIAAEQLGETVPVLRRADSHPDAPARRPVLAMRDLGTPLLDVPVEAVEAERALPANLDQPLASYDPDAIPDSPREPVRPVTPLVHFERPQLIDPGDRFETFELTPLVRAPVDPDSAPASAESGATIHALLDRLERGVTRQDRKPPVPVRAAPQAADGLQQALGTLRRLAAGT